MTHLIGRMLGIIAAAKAPTISLGHLTGSVVMPVQPRRRNDAPAKAAS
jgi:hypothetical protein